METSSASICTTLTKAFCILSVLALALLLVRAQLVRTGMLNDEHAPIDKLIEGTASKPFAYRILVPKTLNAIDAMTPASADQLMDSWGVRVATLGSLRGSAPDAATSATQFQYPRAIFWLFLLQLTAVIIYAFVCAALYKGLFPSASWRHFAAPLSLLPPLLIVQQGVGHIYDFTALCFMALLLNAMRSEKHGLYLLLFALSCLNKETTILASFAYAAVFYQRMPTGRYIAMLGAQVAIFLLSYALVRMAYADNPGPSMVVWIQHQAGYFLRQPIWYYFIVLLIGFLLTYRWNEKPEFLRRAALMVVPHLALVIYAAMPGELRNSYESLPLLSMFLIRNIELIAGQWWQDDSGIDQGRAAVRSD